MTLIFYRLSIKNRWKQVKIGDPGVNWGGADEVHCQINISSELAPAAIASLRSAKFTKSRDLSCGDAPRP